jgi:hypothetical protein
MPYLMVLSYRIITGTLQTQPFDSANHIYVKPVPNVGDGNSVAEAQMTHTLSIAAGTQGYVSGTAPFLVPTVYVLNGQFEVHRHMLQTERPVYFAWDVVAGTTNPPIISSFSLSTGDERPGEGPSDTSP